MSRDNLTLTGRVQGLNWHRYYCYWVCKCTQVTANTNRHERSWKPPWRSVKLLQCRWWIWPPISWAGSSSFSYKEISLSDNILNASIMLTNAISQQKNPRNCSVFWFRIQWRLTPLNGDLRGLFTTFSADFLFTWAMFFYVGFAVFPLYFPSLWINLSVYYFSRLKACNPLNY